MAKKPASKPAAPKAPAVKRVRVKAHTREVLVDRPEPAPSRAGDNALYFGPEGQALPMVLTHLHDDQASGIVSGPSGDFNVSGVNPVGERRWEPVRD